MKIAVQMDHISTIERKKDTSFVLMLEAQKRNHLLYHYVADDLSFVESKTMAHLEPVKVFDQDNKYYTLGAKEHVDLETMDVVLLRQDPPFDMHYITTTFLLENIKETTLVINDPYFVRNSPEKIFVTKFADLMPETLITRNKEDIHAFRENYDSIIIKPLYGNGGSGIFHLKKDDPNFNALIENFQNTYREAFIVQRYLPEIKHGDKRVILLDGEPVGAFNRFAQKGETRSNLHVGGQAQKAEMTKRDLEICARLEPFLKSRGFLLVGIDIIGDYITEINVTSPTGLREILEFDRINVAELFWQKVEERVK